MPKKGLFMHIEAILQLKKLSSLEPDILRLNSALKTVAILFFGDQFFALCRKTVFPLILINTAG